MNQQRATGRLSAQIMWHLAVIAIVLAIPLFIPWGTVLGAALALLLNQLGRDGWRCPVGLRKPPNAGTTVLAGILGGVALFVVTKLFLQHLCEIVMQAKRDLSAFDFSRGHLMEQIPFLLAIVVSAGFGEEVIYRGTVIGRLEAVLPKSRAMTIVIVLISAGIFGLAHAYQGRAGMLLTGLIGLVLGCVYVMCRRLLWPAVLIHATYDVLGLIAIATNFDRTLENWSLGIFNPVS